jgi:hypothetical protein
MSEILGVKLRVNYVSAVSIKLLTNSENPFSNTIQEAFSSFHVAAFSD